MFHKIQSVIPRQDGTLLVHFVSGETKAYDMNPLMEQMDSFQQLRLIPGLFSLAFVDAGGCGVTWNEEIDIDGEELWYNGTIESNGIPAQGCGSPGPR